MSTLIGYARVSTKEQSTDSQVEQLKALGCIRIYQEQVSGKEAVNRPELLKLIDYAREGDTVIVMKTDRLARNTLDALQIAKQLKDKQVGLKLMDIGDTDINSPIGKMLFTMLSTFAELERERIKSRQREGIEAAKAKNVKFGRPVDNDKRISIENLIKDTDLTNYAIAKQLGCSRTTVGKLRTELNL